ncbi:MAG: PCMD domain-containing protein [Bacteroidaceae bacterium]|nr:PCMD domain-containing protein [Bacteroidaceae bacterium]
MKKDILIYLCLIMTVCFLSGCIKNDLPYPRIPAQILSIEADGLLLPPAIDSESQRVVLTLADTTNIKRVNITNVTLTDDAVAEPDIVGVHDLSEPVNFTLSLYKDYKWIISAQQDIKREIAVVGQVGKTVFEVKHKNAYVYVNEHVDLSNIEITTLQLGPEGITTYTPSIDQLHDFSQFMREVEVRYHDTVEIWNIFVLHTESKVTLSSVDAWTRVAWLYGTGLDENVNRFEYREATASEWIDVPEEYMIEQGSSFSARLIHLKPNTEYVARAVILGENGVEETTNEIIFATKGETALPNGGFDEWWKDGSVWNPWNETATPWWDTGNKGAATLGESNTVPTDDAVEGKAAMLQTRFVGIGTIGKLAAGNIFVGRFGKVDGTNGIIHLGQPFNLRPTRLKGYYKYTNGPIDYADKEMSDMIGQPDCMSIYMALGDWDEPVEIRTNPNNRKVFDVNDPHIIAYKSFETTEITSEYTPFELELEYRSTSRIPTYLIIIASGSKLGDYFTGSTQSTLYVDEFSLEWDY